LFPLRVKRRRRDGERGEIRSRSGFKKRRFINAEQREEEEEEEHMAACTREGGGGGGGTDEKRKATACSGRRGRAWGVKVRGRKERGSDVGGEFICIAAGGAVSRKNLPASHRLHGASFKLVVAS